MKNDLHRRDILFALALLPVAVAGGLAVGVYTWEGFSPELRQTVRAQAGGYEPYLLLTTAQTVVYAAVGGFFGRVLSEAVGLWRPLRLEKTPLVRAALAGLICGLLFSLDRWTFGRFIPEVAAADSGVTTADLIASVLYGGIVEEVLLRLFVMSLLAWILWKLLARRTPREDIPARVILAANALAAALFAAGHLPATFLTFEMVGPLVIFRCFLYNSGLGLVFGRLYRKYGIQYAMLCHILCHIVAKSVWLLAG